MTHQPTRKDMVAFLVYAAVISVIVTGTYKALEWQEKQAVIAARV